MRSAIDEDIYRRLCRARAFIDDCYDSPLTLDQIPREACISPYHFHRLFTQAFNITPHKYLTERPIHKAKGVEFVRPPAERFYGTEAIFKDNCGNWFSLTERKE